MTPSDFRFTGQRLEADVALMDYRARFYRPSVGRFIQPDTIVPDPSNPQTLNRYSYTLNNPLKYTDPTGHCSISLGNNFEFDPGPLLGGILCPGDSLEILDIGDDVARPEHEPYSDLIVGDDAPDAILDPPFTEPPQYRDYIGGNELKFDENGIPIDDKPGLSMAQAQGGEQPGDEDDDFGLTLEPGPFAGESIPARGPGRDWTKNEIEEIDRIGYDTGCHTCGATEPGTKSGHFVLDHQPVSALNVDNEPQRLYPHCLHCSQVQGGEVKEVQRRGGRW